MIAAARQRVPGITLEQQVNPPSLDLPDASVDVVVLFAVLTCVPADEAQRALLGELRRVLRVGGLLYISDLWLQTDARNVQRYVRDQPNTDDMASSIYLKVLPFATTTQGGWRFSRLAIMRSRSMRSAYTMNGHPARGFQWFGLKPMHRRSSVEAPAG